MFWLFPGHSSLSQAVSNTPLPSPTPMLVEVVNQVQQASFWDTVFSGIVAGATAGIFIVLMQTLADHLLHKLEKRLDRRLVTFPHEERSIDGKIFDELKPGRSVEYMKTALGAPGMTYKETAPAFLTDFFYDEETNREIEFANDEEKEAFSEKYHATTAYVYQFKNAIVKVTSKDKEVIDSLAVEYRGTGSGLKVPQLPLGWGEEELKLGVSKVTKQLVEECTQFAYEMSRFEDKVILRLYTGSPLYTNYSYFGLPVYDEKNPTDDTKPETFIGATINGVCLHASEERCYVVRYWDYE